MALKRIALAVGSTTATTHTVAAATNPATGTAGVITESGFIQDIFSGNGTRVIKAELTAGGTEIPLAVGAYLPEGAVITNEGVAVEIIVNIG